MATSGQTPVPQPADAGSRKMGGRLNFRGAMTEIVLTDYGEKTGRTLLKDPKLPNVAISLQSNGELTLEEYLQAIETVLAMNGIALLKVGDKFLKVVPVAQARQEEMTIQELSDGASLKDSGELVSQLVILKHLDAAEAKKIVDQFKHAYGQTHVFERNNSLLITDSAAVVNRIIQILQYIDQPIEAREEPHVIRIRFTKASEIKKKLEEIIADSQKEAQKSTVPRARTTGAPGVVAPTTPSVPGVIRAQRPAPVAAVAQDMGEAIEAAERGIIRGTVKIVADDRTSLLIIITRPENMTFFEKIVKVLDVETAPDVMVKVFRLEFAEAKVIAGMLNELIGATTPKDDTKAPAGAAAGTGAEPQKSAALREVETVSRTPSPDGKTKIGELSKDSVKILADERTNALIIMASRSDLTTIEEIIKGMDMMLSQVLVEAVIVEVNLDNTVRTGVDWVQRAMIASQKDAQGNLTPVMAFAGAGGGGRNAAQGALSGASFTSTDANNKTVPLSGLRYYFTYFNLNLDMVLDMVASDGRARIVSSPVIQTVDNKEATIDSAEEIYLYKGKRYAGTGENNTPAYEDDVERKQVGIKLAVKPHINEKKFVVMEITQTIDNPSGTQVINGQEWPVITTRKMEASIAVRSGETIVLGGLVRSSETGSRSKIPILGDIPILGFPFRSDTKTKVNREVIVFITPYVMDNPEEAEADAARRRDSIHVKGLWKRGWSNSKLADEPEAKDGKDRDTKSKAAKPKAGAAAPEVESALRAEEASAPKDPMKNLDPDTVKFINEQEKRWKKNIDRVDERVDRSLEEAATANP